MGSPGRHVGRGRLQHPLRRIARPPVPLRHALLQGGAGRRPAQPVAPRRLRLLGQPPADHAAVRHRVLPHPEAILEPLQQVPAQLLHLGGHRRLARRLALPAGRHLQRAPPARGASPPRDWQPRGGHRRCGHQPVRHRRRRRRPQGGIRGARHPLRGAERLPAGQLRIRRRRDGRNRGAGGRPRRLARRTLLRDAPRHLHHAGGAEAGQPPRRRGAPRGRDALRGGLRVHRARLPPGRIHRPLALSAALPVPRHHPRLFHQPRLQGKRRTHQGRRGQGARFRRRSGL